MNELRVLIIDDSKLARDRMRGVLEAAGHFALDKESPIGATALIVRERIDVVLLDMNMPVMSGSRFATVIRSNPRLDQVRIIFVTGERVENREELARSLGATAVILKQEINSRLIPTIRSAMGLVSRACAVRIALRHGELLAHVADGLTIGRSADSDVQLRGGGISRTHASLTVSDDDVSVVDAGSANGTWVNGLKIEAPTPVQVGDVIRVGDTNLEVVALPADPTKATIRIGRTRPTSSSRREQDDTWVGEREMTQSEDL